NRPHAFALDRFSQVKAVEGESMRGKTRRGKGPRRVCRWVSGSAVPGRQHLVDRPPGGSQARGSAEGAGHRPPAASARAPARTRTGGRWGWQTDSPLGQADQALPTRQVPLQALHLLAQGGQLGGGRGSASFGPALAGLDQATQGGCLQLVVTRQRQ